MPSLDNTRIIENALDDIDIETLLTNETILENKKLLEHNSTVKFYTPIDAKIINKLNNCFNCDLKNEVPFRWVKGDTPPHTDTNIEGDHFNSHLVYLTDNAGKLKINNNEYNIKKGCGYIFDEGLIHETINTDDSFKLILGPFNSRGVMIGVPESTGWLNNINLSSVVLSPPFDRNIYSYTANVSSQLIDINLSFNFEVIFEGTDFYYIYTNDSFLERELPDTSDDSLYLILNEGVNTIIISLRDVGNPVRSYTCLLYTSDATDE